MCPAGGRGDVTATCDVTVHVTDVNDNSPEWSLETPTVVSLIGDHKLDMLLTATDADEGDNATVTYSLHPGQFVSCFIDSMINSALHPSGVAKSSTSFGWDKKGKERKSIYLAHLYNV